MEVTEWKKFDRNVLKLAAEEGDKDGDISPAWKKSERNWPDAEYVTNYVEKGARLGIWQLGLGGCTDKMTGE